MPTYACNNEITDVFYSGYTIERIYGCDNRLSYQRGKPIARVMVSDNPDWIYIMDYGNNSAVTRSDVETSLTTGELNSIIYLQILDGCVKIDDNAFKGITTLTKITTLGYDVTTVGKAAFSGCTSLTDPVFIGCNLTKINSNAFKDCPQLTRINVCPDVPPALGTGAFDNTNNCPIVVPSGKASVYRYASGWSNYASRIQ